MARHVDRFDFKDAIDEASIEVYLKLKRLVSDLQVKMLFIAFTTLLLLFTIWLQNSLETLIGDSLVEQQ